MATPWAKIKKEYLESVTPKELAKKYKITAKQIHEKASKENWVDEKASIYKNVQEKVQERIGSLTNLALDTLEEIIKAPETESNTKVSACKTIIDISGLKSSKQEITSANLTMQKVFVTKEEEKKIEKHIKAVLDE